MGQIEIYELLKKKRLAGDDSYFPVARVRKMLRAEGKPENCNTGLQLAQLESFGYCEAKKIHKNNEFWRAFRLKSKYLED
jgi:hypothetical protein